MPSLNATAKSLLVLFCIGFGPQLKGATFVVRMGNYFFNPTNLSINPGDTVRWSNTVTRVHDTTHNPPTDTPLWAQDLALRQTFSFTFSNAGYYPYICLQHIGSNPEQTGTVTVASANLPPTATVTNPANGAIFTAPATFPVQAAATDDGGVAQVEFFAGTTSLGVDTTSPFSVIASNLPVGAYALTARVTDAQGLSATSSVVNVTVNPGHAPPGLAPIPDRVMAPQTRLVITNAASDAETPANLLVFSLAAGFPDGVQINETNGVLTWIPRRTQAPSTNLIAVVVTDNGVPPLSATQSFTVFLGHYLELSLGEAVLRAGNTSAVPLHLYSSAGLTNLTFTLEESPEYLTNLTLQAQAAALTSASLQSNSLTRSLIQFAAAPGQPIQGTQQLAQIHFLALSNRPSAFVSLGISGIAASGPTVTVTNLYASSGRAVVIGEEPLLEARTVATNQTDSLTLYGKPGFNYVVEFCPNPVGAGPWLPAYTNLLEGLFDVNSGISRSNHPAFYRARQQ